MEREFSAKASLNRNIKFWFEQCGLSKERVIHCIDNWYDLAYPSSEQEKAKKEAIEKLIK
ncbi:TPA: hypothetical protein MJA81_23045 [Klebsiella pneumoniae]|nr:hypothetical protein [Klebsiella pneumoniae]HBY9803167.1 hypothetical protein [Klebsiella pneumoniae]